MEILISNNQDISVNEELLKKIAEYVLKQEGISDAELSIALVSEDEIRRLNASYRGKDSATDVLSFEVEPSEQVGGIPRLLGDVVICPAVASAQAKEYGQTFEQEMGLLLTHGILHLLGYDHQEDAEAEKMEARERDILSAFFGKTSAKNLSKERLEH